MTLIHRTLLVQEHYKPNPIKVNVKVKSRRESRKSPCRGGSVFVLKIFISVFFVAKRMSRVSDF